MSERSSPETETLLPCPFCGGTDIQSGTCYVEGIVGVADAVRCAGCGVRGLKDVWNTRKSGHAQTQQQPVAWREETFGPGKGWYYSEQPWTGAQPLYAASPDTSTERK